MADEMIVDGVQWTRTEAGWWSSVLGGVVHETNGWRFWPVNEARNPTQHAFRTMRNAMRHASTPAGDQHG